MSQKYEVEPALNEPEIWAESESLLYMSQKYEIEPALNGPEIWADPDSLP